MKKQQQQDLHQFFQKNNKGNIVDMKAAMIATIFNILTIKETKMKEKTKI